MSLLVDKAFHIQDLFRDLNMKPLYIIWIIVEMGQQNSHFTDAVDIHTEAW